MSTVGTVISILNEHYLLIRAEPMIILSADEELIVFEEVLNDKVKAETGIEKLKIPKGHVIVQANQGNDIYLASVITTKTERRTVYKNSSPILNPTLALRGLFGTPEEVVMEIPSPEKAILNKDQSIGLQVKRIVNVGDKVTRKGGL